MNDEPIDVAQAREELEVLAALERMFRCERRGVCLLKEWMRRYGNPGNGCNCWYHFSETYLDTPTRELDI